MFKIELKILISVSWVLISCFVSKWEGKMPYENIWKIQYLSLGEVGRQNGPEGGRPTWSRLLNLCSGPLDLIFWRWVLIGSRSMSTNFFSIWHLGSSCDMASVAQPLVSPKRSELWCYSLICIVWLKIQCREVILALPHMLTKVYLHIIQKAYMETKQTLGWNTAWAKLYSYNQILEAHYNDGNQQIKLND